MPHHWPLTSDAKDYFDLNKPDWNKGIWLYDFVTGNSGNAYGKSSEKRGYFARFFGYQAYEESQGSWISSPMMWHLLMSVGAGAISFAELNVEVGDWTSFGIGLQQASPFAMLIGVGTRYLMKGTFEGVLGLSKGADQALAALELRAQQAAFKVPAAGKAKTASDLVASQTKAAFIQSEKEKMIQSHISVSGSPPDKVTEGLFGRAAESRVNSDPDLVGKIAEAQSKKYDEVLKTEYTDKVGSLKERAVSASDWAQVSHGLSVASWVMMAYDVLDMVMDETVTKEVKTTCTPWVAPQVTEDDQCEQCNPETYMDKSGKPTDFRAFLGCSEYRCKSFGASCSLINEGTKDEKCVSLSLRDVNAPLINPWKEELEKFNLNVKQESRNGIVLEYTKSNDKKLPIYENFVISLKTDEPSQCKFSTEIGKPYKDMEDIWFGGAQYQYYHAQFMQFQSPGINDTKTAVSGGGLKQFYIKCADAVGNANQADYAIQFVVSDEPDMTPPTIQMMNPAEETYLSVGTSKTPVTLFVNEPSTCKWDFVDESYDGMNVKNICRTSDMDDLGLYECKFIHEGEGSALPFGPVIQTDAQPGETKLVYFKCADKSNNKNKVSKVFTLHGSAALNITSVKPEGEMFVKGEQMNVTLEVTTEGGAHLNGQAKCGFTDQVALKDAVPPSIQEFFETNANVHKQSLTPSNGNYDYYVGCVDDAGNTAYSEIKFSIKKDENPPVIVRVYRDLMVQPVLLNLELNEEGSCQYSDKAFVYGEGSEFLAEGKTFSAEIDGRVIYVICQDVYGNKFDPVKVSFLS